MLEVVFSSVYCPHAYLSTLRKVTLGANLDLPHYFEYCKYAVSLHRREQQTRTDIDPKGLPSPAR